MKATEELLCRMIPFDSKNFESELLAGLENDCAFAVTDLPEELKSAIKNLFLAGDDLFDNIHETKVNSYNDKLEKNDINGLHDARKYKFGCNNGSRFYITLNKDANVTNEEMPLYHGQPLMADAAKVYHHYTDEIVARVAKAIAAKYSIPVEEMTTTLFGGSILGLTRYYPLTQKRVVQMFTDNALQMDGQAILQFAQHRDISPMTLIAYRGEIRGLMGQDVKTKLFKKISVNSGGEPYLVVFTGLTLKELTNGNVKPLKHQVVTSAKEQELEAQTPSNEWRFSLARFVMCNRPQIEPLPTLAGGCVQPAKQRKHNRQYPIESARFFSDSLVKENQRCRKVHVNQLPVDEILKYPTNVIEKDLYTAEFGEDSIGTYVDETVTRQDCN